MIQIVQQREYIDNFLKFVSTFLIKEAATIEEMDLVESNTKILMDRIKEYKRNTPIGGVRIGCSDD